MICASQDKWWGGSSYLVFRDNEYGKETKYITICSASSNRFGKSVSACNGRRNDGGWIIARDRC
jgi:hypothetical protein